MTFDTIALANILRTAAKAEILPRFRRLGDDQIKTKTDAVDLVTEADEAAERAITDAIIAQAPGTLVVGEEAVAARPELLGGIGEAELSIVVDPIDGTANYAAGLPLFGVMAAVVSGGETVAGVIYDPMGDDWIMADKGAGAFLVRPDGDRTRLSVADPVPLEEMVGHVSLGHMPTERKARVFPRLVRPRIVANYRCAAHDYRTLATGHCQFLMYSKLMPWDHLAGALIVQEAGGYCAKLDGSAYRATDTDGGLIVASSQETWNTVSEDLFA